MKPNPTMPHCLLASSRHDLAIALTYPHGSSFTHPTGSPGGEPEPEEPEEGEGIERRRWVTKRLVNSLKFA